MTNMTGSKLSIFSHPGKITGYWIITRSFPYQGPYWPGQYGPRLRLRPIWVSLFQMSEVCNKQFNTWAFPYWPGYYPSIHIVPRLRLGPIWGSRDDNQANMEMPMYQSVCIAKQYSAKVTCLGERERFQNDFNGTIFR